MSEQNEEDRTLVEQLLSAATSPGELAEKTDLAQRYRRGRGKSRDLDERFLRRVVDLERRLEEARSAHTELESLIEHLTAPPQFPAILLKFLGSEGRPLAMVLHAGWTRIVALSPDMDTGAFAAGDEVWLAHELNVIVGRSPDGPRRCGETARFERLLADGRILLRQRDEEIVVEPVASLVAASLRAGDSVRWDRTAKMAFEKLADASHESWFIEETPSETFDDIGGLDSEITRIRRVIDLHLRHGDVARKYALSPVRSILLTGPAGVGKTTLARALANWAATLSGTGKARFINVKPGSLNSMWWGETERNYRKLFRAAREAGEANPGVPVILFVDEVDAIGACRGSVAGGVNDRVMPAFMGELSGFEAPRNVLVVAATNRRDALDPALLRPGRLGDLVLEIPRPNADAATAIFSRHLPAGVPFSAGEGGGRDALIDATVSRLYAPNADTDLATLVLRDGARRVVRIADLISGADIERICKLALERACAREIETDVSGLCLDDLLAAAVERFEVAAHALTPASCRAHVSHLPGGVDVVAVEPVRRRVPFAHRYLNAA